MMSLPIIKIGSLANTRAMSVARMMGARLLLSVSLVQLAMTTPLVMAQYPSWSPPNSPPLSPLKSPSWSPPNSPPLSPLKSPSLSPPNSPPLSPLKSPSLSTPKWFSSLWIIIVVVTVVVVCVKILVVLAVLRYCLRINRKRAGHANGDLPTPEQTPPRADVEDFNAQELAVCQRHNMGVREYSYAEVEAFSGNWVRKLGEGGFGTVYYGEILKNTSPNAIRQKVALKRLRATSQQGKNEFLNEVRLLSRIHHRHLVPLVGFCDEANHQVLIYEYMQEGSLADWLHGAQRDHFSWHNRLDIALHAALGLQYLHEGARPNIIHRDVKSSNILIARKWEGKIADFGLSKTNSISDPISDRGSERSHWTTAGVRGTPGYLDPEYLTTGMLTTKSDVYSFGIVLLELITGRLPIIDCSEGNPQFQNIKRHVQNHDPHNLVTIADPKLKGNYDMPSMKKIAEVALRSVASQGINRPTMSNVVAEIQSAMELGRDSPATTNTHDSSAESDTGPLLNLQ